MSKFVNRWIVKVEHGYIAEKRQPKDGGVRVPVTPAVAKMLDKAADGYHAWLDSQGLIKHLLNPNDEAYQ